MRKEVTMIKDYEDLVNVWFDHMLTLAEEFEHCAERYPMGSRNWLELKAKATGIKTATEHFIGLDSELRTFSSKASHLEA